ncbi:MAG: hypothetical protein RKE49_04710 [Oceanicaulis sp.]
MIQLLGISALVFVQPTEAETACGAPEGSQALLAETAGQVLVVGELHGTNEAPGFAGSLTCLALSQDETVTLALEIPADDQPALDVYLASEGGESDSRAMFEGFSSSFWTWSDGRSSQAMLRLIDGVRGWRGAGMPVSLQAIDAGDADYLAAEDPQEPTIRDRAMIRRALAAQAETDRVIVLVGNIHARRTALVSGDMRIETMGTLSEPGRLALVNTLYGEGEAWNCTMPDGELVCGAREIFQGPVSGEPRVLSGAEAEALNTYAAYDHFVYLGSASVSPPARPETAAEAQ